MNSKVLRFATAMVLTIIFAFFCKNFLSPFFGAGWGELALGVIIGLFAAGTVRTLDRIWVIEDE